MQKLFCQKYTQKERFLWLTAIIPMGAGQRIAGYYITNYLGMSMSETPSREKILPLLIGIGIYMFVAYLATYYVIKVLTEISLFVYGKIKYKLTGKRYVPDTRKY